MRHEILGDQFQWLKVHLQEESIGGKYGALLYKSSEIRIEDEKVFSGMGHLIFSGNGKIKEFYVGDREAVIFSQDSILVYERTVRQEFQSTSYATFVKVSGPGMVFVSGREFMEFYLDEGESADVRTASIVAMDSTVTYLVGSTLSTVSGPGAVLLENNTERTGKEREKEEKEKEKEKEGMFIFDQL